MALEAQSPGLDVGTVSTICRLLGLITPGTKSYPSPKEPPGQRTLSTENDGDLGENSPNRQN